MEESKGRDVGIKLSIAIPAYNGEKYIHKPLDSIIPQLKGIEELTESAGRRFFFENNAEKNG